MGSQEPSERTAPDRSYSDGEDAVRIVCIGGIELDPWQKTILQDWFARSDNGIWASSICGGSVPRQNGKSLLVQARAEAGMLLFNEVVIYTAHLQKTATETFEEMRDFFESPKLKKYVKEIKSAIGREQIILKSGAKIKFLARTRNGGRGQHGDLLIIDEAQEIDSKQQASFMPALSASMNPQTVYVGTPPDPEAPGTVFRSIREKALSDDHGKLAWFEFSVKEIGDIKDTKRWAATNPALGRRMLLTTIEGEAEVMDPDEFARERLGWWTPVRMDDQEELAIDTDNWKACRSDAEKPEGKTAYAVKFKPDGSEVCVAGAVIPDSGAPRISLIYLETTSHGIRWLSEWLNDRYSKASCVVIDGKNGAEVLIEQIAPVWRLKDSIVRVGSNSMIAAVGMLTNAINEQSITWYSKQELLDESATTATRRSIGGGWGFGGEKSLPIEACALAYWGAKTSKRNPTRKMRIG